MKIFRTSRSPWCRALALLLPLAAVGGCSWLPGSQAFSGRPDREFMQRVAEDPFPTAAQKGISH